MAVGLKKEVTINMLLRGMCGNAQERGVARHLPRWTLFDEIGWGEEEDVVTTAAAMSSRKGAVHNTTRGGGADYVRHHHRYGGR